MRLFDILGLPIAALWQQKSRTMLTTLGVVFGSFVLAASLSIGEGVQETIGRERRRSDMLRRITVYPQWGAEAARARRGRRADRLARRICTPRSIRGSDSGYRGAA